MLELIVTPGSELPRYLKACQAAIDRQSPNARFPRCRGVSYQKLNESWLNTHEQYDGEHWKSQALDEVFVALAASEQLDEVLGFKGARVLTPAWDWPPVPRPGLQPHRAGRREIPAS